MILARKKIDISIAVLESLKDAEYHTITATTLMVAKYFHLTKSEMSEIYDSRKLVPSNSLYNKKIYTQVQLTVSLLRKAKFLKNFPGTKNKGIFTITNKGSLLLTKTPSEIKKVINSELEKFDKTTQYYLQEFENLMHILLVHIV